MTQNNTTLMQVKRLALVANLYSPAFGATMLNSTNLLLPTIDALLHTGTIASIFSMVFILLVEGILRYGFETNLDELCKNNTVIAGLIILSCITAGMALSAFLFHTDILMSLLCLAVGSAVLGTFASLMATIFVVLSNKSSSDSNDNTEERSCFGC